MVGMTFGIPVGGVTRTGTATVLGGHHWAHFQSTHFCLEVVDYRGKSTDYGMELGESRGNRLQGFCWVPDSATTSSGNSSLNSSLNSLALLAVAG